MGAVRDEGVRTIARLDARWGYALEVRTLPTATPTYVVVVTRRDVIESMALITHDITEAFTRAPLAWRALEQALDCLAEEARVRECWEDAFAPLVSA